MSYLDTSKLCFCGTGKKIKFCCKDIVADLEKIVKMLRGKQFAAARETIDRALQSHPDRASLWLLKVELLGMDDRLDEQRQCAEEFARAVPENPAALCYAAKYRMQDLLDSDLDEAEPEWVEEELQQICRGVHQALAKSPEGIASPMVPETLSSLCNLLLNFGFILPAIEHLKLLYAMSESDEVLRRLKRVLSNFNLPIAEKTILTLPRRVDWVDWKEDYQRALELFVLGGITPAAEIVESLLEQNEPHPVLLRARAALRSLLPNTEITCAACRAVIDHVDVPLEAAVEAGALLDILAPRSEACQYLRQVTYPVLDASRVLETLQSSRRIKLSTEFRPPMKAAFQLLDREEPDPHNEITLEQLPRLRAEGALFGKETDSEARLEFITSREDVDEVKQFIEESCRPYLGNPSQEPLAEDRLDESLGAPVLPPHVSPELRKIAIRDAVLSTFVDKWCQRPQAELDQKTPLEAAADRGYRRRLAGMVQSICNLWQQVAQSPDEAIVYEHLGLPVPTPLKLKPGEIIQLPVSQMMFIDAESLSDADLVTAVAKSMEFGIRKLVVRFGTLLMSRPSFAESDKRSIVLTYMAYAQQDPADEFEYLARAREAAAACQLPVEYLLIEQLRCAIMMGNNEARVAIFDELKRDGHLENPEVQQMLVQLMNNLRKAGLIEAEPSAQGANPVDDAETAPTPPVWTPDATPAATDAGASAKSGLWLPGMD